MSNQPIGIFDSGVGGLSILQEIKVLLPQESLIYLADQLFLPYGSKTKDELVKRVDGIMSLFKAEGVKAVVVACNTATIYTIDEMRSKYTFPIIGTVPVVKVIARITKTGKTAVLSTPGTAKSEYLDKLIEQYAPNTTVTRVGGSNLEELVEGWDLEASEIESVLKSTLTPLIEAGVDAIALGCTHYPFLKDKMQEIVGDNVAIVDSGGAVARRLKEVLTNENLLSAEKRDDLYYTTGEAARFSSIASGLLGEKIEAKHLDL